MGVQDAGAASLPFGGDPFSGSEPLDLSPTAIDDIFRTTLVISRPQELTRSIMGPHGVVGGPTAPVFHPMSTRSWSRKHTWMGTKIERKEVTAEGELDVWGKKNPGTKNWSIEETGNDMGERSDCFALSRCR